MGRIVWTDGIRAMDHEFSICDFFSAGTTLDYAAHGVLPALPAVLTRSQQLDWRLDWKPGDDRLSILHDRASLVNLASCLGSDCACRSLGHDRYGNYSI